MPMPRLRAALGESIATSSPSRRIVAAVRPDDAGEHLHQRRLAGAVLADHGVDGAALDVDVHVGERDHAAIALGEVPDRDEGLGQSGIA